MDSYLISTVAELRREDLRREARRERLAAAVREPHPWRHGTGRALIRLGRLLAEEPAERRPARPRARTA